MIMTTKTQKAEPLTATLPMSDGEQEFNWRRCWYPVTFVQDLPADRPYKFSLYDEPFVLFRNQDGKLGCLTDRCCHRAARLSDGQIIDGKIECLYHGWQFGSNGQCLHIPQLPADAKIPAKACVQSFAVVERQGIVWVWPGESEAADKEYIPMLAAWEKPGFVHTDLMFDLPYEQTYLIENVMDPAHVPITHDGSQGKREDAQPLEMEVIENSASGIRCRWRKTRNPNETWRQIDFVAPNLVHHRFEIEERGRLLGLVMYSLPLGRSRCRLLFRGYGNFMTWIVKLRPRWLDHLNQTKILEQDLPRIARMQQQIERLGQSLKEIYLPLKTSDTFVIEYRKWLDKFGSDLPFYQGYSTSKHARVGREESEKLMLLDRFKRHTQICSSCTQAYRVAIRLKQTFVGVAIALAALAIVTDVSWIQIVAVSASVSSAALAAVAQKVKTKFEGSHTGR